MEHTERRSRWAARPTVYRGIQMRSRLEARWAAHFDSGCWVDEPGFAWRYEGLAFADRHGQYLPDFVLTVPDVPTSYVEVKPESLSIGELREVQRRMETIWASVPEAVLVLVVGEPGDHVTFEASHRNLWVMP
jgi:hypothetical protein